jgi:hypothetical protein
LFKRIEADLRHLAVNYTGVDDLNTKRVSQLASQFYACTLNKLESPSQVEQHLNDEFNQYLVNEIELNAANDRQIKCLNLWIWITKALVLREHKLFQFYTNKVTNQMHI